LRAKPTKSIKEHQAIVAAIKNGDSMLSCSNAQDHRRRARSELLPLLDQFGMKHL
jgi:DNA-binding GntR family transcriptional regulator